MVLARYRSSVAKTNIGAWKGAGKSPVTGAGKESCSGRGLLGKESEE
jgi:hypothetical protein